MGFWDQATLELARLARQEDKGAAQLDQFISSCIEAFNAQDWEHACLAAAEEDVVHGSLDDADAMGDTDDDKQDIIDYKIDSRLGF
ncbi:hypothetical protein HDU88_005392 [Geranomyces variabilis]|nr:hypothetical protein HDU88_005392 [Geranomyces variabilis]